MAGEAAARIAVLHTQVCARVRPEATAVPVRCHVAGLVVKKKKRFSADLNLAAFFRPHLLQRRTMLSNEQEDSHWQESSSVFYAVGFKDGR